MILIRFMGMFVFAETLVFFIIIFVNLFSGPVVAFNSEMIVGFRSQYASSCSRFQQTLSKDDAGRNFICFLLSDSNGVEFFNVCLIIRV